MDKIIAPCGLNCAECEAYKATQARDTEELGKIAAKWSVQYKADLKLEDVLCDGCLSEGGRNGCYSRMCSVRKCSTGRRVACCGECRDFGCDRISEFLEMVPEAKPNINEIRAKRRR